MGQAWGVKCSHMHGELPGDHAAVSLQLTPGDSPLWGSGVWRFPLYLLAVPAYVEGMKAGITAFLANTAFLFHLVYMGFATGNLPEPALCTSGLADSPHHTCRQGTQQPTHAHAPTPKQAVRATYTISAGVASRAAVQPQEGLRRTPGQKAIQGRPGVANPKAKEEGLWSCDVSNYVRRQQGLVS
jgi:hypothetical protein